MSRSLVLAWRGLAYYWRTNVAVVLGVATAVAVLAGALLVGDSVRGSLRDLVLQRLGRADRIVVSPTFFRERLADDLRGDNVFSTAFDGVAPLVVLPGIVSEQGSGRHRSRVQVYGVDDRFWRFHAIDGASGPLARDAWISPALAVDIGAVIGATLLVRVERPSAIPLESLHGRKEDRGDTLRLTLRRILNERELGEFSLQPQQGAVRVVYVPLSRLQRDLDLDGRVNALVVSERKSRPGGASVDLDAVIRRRATLDDVGLTVRAVGHDTIAVETAAGVLDDARAKAVDVAARNVGGEPQPVFTYLVNTIRGGGREVPYSLVTATDLAAVAPTDAPTMELSLSPAAIVINEWLARDLAVKQGDPLELEYYVWADPGVLVTRTADFRVTAVVPITGAAADRDLVPVYPGITDSDTLRDWDPPFPIDLRRVRKIDEDYWDTYRTTPKAFISFEVGRTLWRTRYGDRSSVRIMPPPGQPIDEVRARLVTELGRAVDPVALGLAARDVRDEGLGASRGATDFGQYFTYFSFFLVVSALLLAVLFFKLGIEQRAREVGLFRSVGYSTGAVRRLFVIEGLLLVVVGSALGVVGAVVYGFLMISGLRTWWTNAVGTKALTLHVTASALAIGAAGAVVAAMACIWWTLRTLAHVSERSLLSGSLGAGESESPNGGRSPRATSWPAIGVIGFAAVGVALMAAALAGLVDRTGSFFAVGVSLLGACLCLLTVWLRRPPRTSIGGHGWRAVARVGLRNAANRPGRSVLSAAVIASATFVLVSVDAFRQSDVAPTDRRSGVGGYTLQVALLVPIAYDPNTPNGLDALGLAGEADVSIEPFRLRPGDDASCLNLYEPRNPRILGASTRFISSGRFTFESSLATTDAERANPWLLLNRDLGDGTVPAIADANSMTYVLHRALGDEITIERGGRPVRLRFVAALADSIFQSELLIADAKFIKLFPEQQGYQYLLVDAPPARARPVASAIAQAGTDMGAEVVSTSARLAEFHRVQNTYLSTFQTLGGLGLLVGTVGLAAVLLRNVLERRRELALLLAVGYRRAHIFAIIVAENLLLLSWGVVAGVVCALVAIAPAVGDRGGRVPMTAAGWLLVFAVFATGVVSSMVATTAALRAPLLESLRAE